MPFRCSLFCVLVLGAFSVFPAAAESDARVTAWTQDLDFLVAEFVKKEGGFTPDERAAFDADIASLRLELPSLDDEHIVAHIMKAVAHARNGHTGAYPPREDQRFGRVPVRFWYFVDGLYVVRTRPEYAHLLGTRLTSVGEHPVDIAVERVGALAYGNSSWKRMGAAMRLAVPALLYGVELVPTRDRAEYEFRLADGTTKRETLLPEAPVQAYQHAIWDLAPTSETPDGPWRYAYTDTSNKAPLYLRDPNNVLWHEYLKDTKTLYIQYNASVFRDGDDRRALIDGMLAAVDDVRFERVVVDLRLNGGGDLTQMRGAFNRMMRNERLAKPGRLYVITGAATFSAGLFHAANLKQQGATVVGELVGDDMDFWAEGGMPIELPNSKMRVGASTGFHSYSRIEYPQYKDQLYLNLDIDTLEPDIPVEMTFDDYKNGRDPVLDAILNR